MINFQDNGVFMRRPSAKTRKLRRYIFGGTLFLVCSVLVAKFNTKSATDSKYPVSVEQLRQGLGPFFLKTQWPQNHSFRINGQAVEGQVRYSIDESLQRKAQDMFENYKPDYGALAAIDPRTGRVLALVSYSANPQTYGNLALRAIFPAASIFKMVTATAAIDQQTMTPASIMPFNGSSHTLYKKNIETTQFNRWTRYMSLKQAFAQSVNSYFGKIGVHYLGPKTLSAYAQRFKFNQAIQNEIPVDIAEFELSDGNFALAESASGFTQGTKISPLHGALMAAAVVNDGVMMNPSLVDSVQSNSGERLFHSETKVLSQTMDATSAAGVRDLMRETVSNGTSRKSFREIFGRDLDRWEDLELGGKTGSLTGEDPEGRVDWFVGYANVKGQQLAIAAVTVHEKLWRVKSSYVAGSVLESFVKRFTIKRTLASATQARKQATP